MKVKNYIIENCYVFIDELERELCKRGISYVRIDREIHFLNQIIRLYDFELDRDIIYSRLINGISLKNQNDFLLRPQNHFLSFICKYDKMCTV